MKFPLRLSLDLLRSRVTRALAGDAESPVIFHLSPAAFSSTDQREIEAESDPNAAIMEVPASVISQTTAPILWIGGEEPLQHPVIGRISAALNKAGRTVFLHTDGLRLRQRIHEFRPDERLFLTVELAGRGEIHDASVGRSGAFQSVVEGIRAAKLSGFYVCSHFTVNESADACRTNELFEYLDKLDVDGLIVSSGGGAASESGSAEMQEKLEEIRALVRCSRWEYFSTLLEASYASAREKKAAVVLAGGESGACEESV